MKKGVELLDIELGKKSDKYKVKYNKMCEHVINKLKGVCDEVELIDKFNISIKEFRTNEKNKSGLFHESIKTGHFDNYNLFFFMKDCFEKINLKTNLFTLEKKYFVKTENFYVMQNNIIVDIEKFPYNDKIYVVNNALILTKEYEKLMNYYRKKDSEKAIEFFEKIENAIENYHNTMETITLNYSRLTVDLLNDIYPNHEDYEIDYIRGELFLREKNYLRAEEEFKKVLRSNKIFKNVFYDIGYSLFKQNKYNEALYHFHKTPEKDPDVLLHIGLSYYKIGKYDNAINYLNQTLLVNEKSEEAYIYGALSCMKKGGYDVAKTIMKEAQRKIGKKKKFSYVLEMINTAEKNGAPYIQIDNKNDIYRIFKEVKA